MRISTFHLPVAGNLRDLLNDLLAVSAAGIKQAWLTEHHGPQAVIHNPLLTIAHTASLTLDLKFGTAVLPALAWNLDRLTEDVAMLEALVPGQFDIGLGARPAGSASEREDEQRLNEAIDRLQDLIGYDRLWMSTVSDEGWIKAAEKSCGIIASPPLESEHFPQLKASYTHGLSVPLRSRIARSVYVLVAENPADLLTPSFFIDADELETLAARPGRPPTKSPNRLASRLIAGSASAVKIQIQALRDAGVTDLLCCLDIPGTPTEVRRRTLDTLAAIAHQLDYIASENSKGVSSGS